MVKVRGCQWKVFVSGLFALMMIGATAQAADVFLNGVRVNGLSNQSFEDASIRFDAKGDVHITVKNVKVQMVEQSSGVQQKPAVAVLQKRYWLVGNQTVRGMTQYNVDVHINGQLVTRFKNNEMQQVKEVTKYLLKGKNTVVFTAMKSIKDQRLSFSPEHAISILIGEGDDEGKQLTINRSMAEYKRFATQVENHTATETFDAR